MLWIEKRQHTSADNCGKLAWENCPLQNLDAGWPSECRGTYCCGYVLLSTAPSEHNLYSQLTLTTALYTSVRISLGPSLLQELSPWQLMVNMADRLQLARNILVFLCNIDRHESQLSSAWYRLGVFLEQL